MKKIKNDAIRTKEFQRNQSLECFLEEINNNLWISEQQLLVEVKNELPLIFVVGPHRSGSTLFLQWLANTKQFSYPTNMLSRFFKAPIIGAKIQQLLPMKNIILEMNF